MLSYYAEYLIWVFDDLNLGQVCSFKSHGSGQRKFWHGKEMCKQSNPNPIYGKHMNL